MNDETMNDDDLDIPYDIDFSGGAVGKYYELFTHSTSVVILDPDLSAEFPDSASVNQALRGVVRERRKHAKQTSGAAGSNKT